MIHESRIGDSVPSIESSNVMTVSKIRVAEMIDIGDSRIRDIHVAEIPVAHVIPREERFSPT